MKTLCFGIVICAFSLAVAAHAESARSLVYQAYDTSDNAEAIRLFNRALEEDADFIYAYAGRGLRKQQQGDLAGAIEDFTKAIEKNPLFRDAYIWRAKAKQQKGDEEGYHADMTVAEQAAQKGDYALAELDKSIENDPQDAQGYLDRARHKKHKGQLEGAIEDYNHYLLYVGGRRIIWRFLNEQTRRKRQAILTARLAITRWQYACSLTMPLHTNGGRLCAVKLAMFREPRRTWESFM